MASEREVAAQAQEKFNFYAVGLVFTLLALSVQTGHFAGPAFRDALELGGWIALLSSGLFGLWRLEYVPLIREKFAFLSETHAVIDRLESDKRQGVRTIFVVETHTEVPIEQRIAEHREALTRLQGLVKKLERQAAAKYAVHRYGFGAGLVLLIAARAYEPLSSTCAWVMRHVA